MIPASAFVTMGDKENGARKAEMKAIILSLIVVWHGRANANYTPLANPEVSLANTQLKAHSCSWTWPRSAEVAK